MRMVRKRESEVRMGRMVSKGSGVKSEMGVGGAEMRRWGAELVVSMARNKHSQWG